jgi:hypothetical protein
VLTRALDAVAPWWPVVRVLLIVAAIAGVAASGWALRGKVAGAELAELSARHAAELADIRNRAEQARADAEADARRIVEHQARVGREIERDLSTRLAGADARARDLAGRLRRALAAAGPACGGAVPGDADAPGEPAAAAGEPADAGEAGAAVAAHLAACERDASRLEGWQTWWAGVSRP